MTIIYALSGIALNHIVDWNPSYSISHEEVVWERDFSTPVAKAEVLEFLERYGEEKNYKKHYRPDSDHLKVFLKGGSVMLNVHSGHGYIEHLRKRPVFYEVNLLHYNPKRLWTWFSDIFCVALLFFAIGGLFMIKGKKGITGRGAWLTAIGVALPLAFLYLYM